MNVKLEEFITFAIKVCSMSFLGYLPFRACCATFGINGLAQCCPDGDQKC